MMSEAGAATSLEPDTLIAAAVAETGLDDFGPDDFAPRLHVLCRSLREEARLNDAGVLAQAVLVTGLLRNRLLLEDLVGRHPEILDERVEKPIVICGLPRTGTTHLHNLMSSDPALRSLPYWESMEPVLAERERLAAGDPDPRWERTDMALSFLDVAMPEFKRMHEMTVDHVHEEIQLLAIDFSTMLFETIAPIPSWRDNYLARDQRPSYAYLKKILQALQWLRGGTRWVLKSPQHLELGHDQVDLRWVGDYWSERLRHMLQACVDARDVLPATRTIDVHFDEFMGDDVAMVRRIYDLAYQPFTDDAEAAMVSFMDRNPRGRHGAVLYDLGQFGLDRARLRDALSFYVDHFGVSEEGG